MDKMRNIAIIKNCLEIEKNLILSSVEKEDEVLFFQNEEELLKSQEFEKIEINRLREQETTVTTEDNRG